MSDQEKPQLSKETETSELILSPELRVSEEIDSTERTILSTGTGTYTFNSQTAFKNEIEIAADTIIADTYRVIKLIGKGGMGQVYLAEHLTLHKQCALKILPANQVTEKAWLRFQTEARAVAKLEHPNLVRVTDLGVHDKTMPFYAMDFVDGMSLDQYIREGRQLSRQSLLGIYLQVLEGLKFAHASGIIHRDLKPANIVVIGEPNSGIFTAKILDFGLAKLTQAEGADLSLTATGEIFGSPFYMSPEQCLGETVDARSDLYSFGCALFECLTGKPPYTGNSLLAVMSKHQMAEIPKLSELLSEAPSLEAREELKQIETFLTKLLQKKPENRYQSAQESISDLKLIISKGKLTETTAKVKQGKPSPQKTLAITALALTLAMAGAAYAFLNHFSSPLQNASPIEATESMLKTAEALQGASTFPPLVNPSPEECYERIRQLLKRYDLVMNTLSDAQLQNNLAKGLVAEKEATKAKLVSMGEKAIPASLAAIKSEGQIRFEAVDVLRAIGKPAVAPIMRLCDEHPEYAKVCAGAIGPMGESAIDYLIDDMIKNQASIRNRLVLLEELVGRSRSAHFSTGNGPLQLSSTNQNKLFKLISAQPDSDDMEALLKLATARTVSNAPNIDKLGEILLKNSDNSIVKLAITSLGDTIREASEEGYARPVGYLSKKIESTSDEEIRENCLRAISKASNKLPQEAINLAQRLTSDEVSSVKQTAISLLIVQTPFHAEGKNYILKGLETPNSPGYYTALQYIDTLSKKDPSVLQALAKAAETDHSARRRLLGIGAEKVPEGIDIVISTLKNEKRLFTQHDTQEALHALELMEPKIARKAIPTLEEMLRQPNLPNRTVVETVLKNIQKGS
ncbi:MAG: serine/threonine protein kinase [Candidatus Obscuribacterales bacterium]|nr:serine/threonine protein kinase [Candidatus Obscuribacterales bacterium]